MILNLRYKIIVKNSAKSTLLSDNDTFYLKCDFSIKEKRIKKSAIDLSTCLSTKTIIDDRPDKMFYIKAFKIYLKFFERYSKAIYSS